MLEVGGHELQCVIGGGVELGTQRFFSFFFFHFDSRNKTSWQSFYCLPGALFDQIWQRWCLPPSVSPCHLGIACANFFLWKCLCKRVWLVILSRDSPQYFQQEKKKKGGWGGKFCKNGQRKCWYSVWACGRDWRRRLRESVQGERFEERGTLCCPKKSSCPDGGRRHAALHHPRGGGAEAAWSLWAPQCCQVSEGWAEVGNQPALCLRDRMEGRGGGIVVVEVKEICIWD